MMLWLNIRCRFDRVDVAKLGLKIGAAEVEAAIAACDGERD